MAIALAAIVAGSTSAIGAPAASAAVTYSRTGIAATMNGQSVQASVTIAASTSVAAAQAGVCARNAAGVNTDFPMRAATITPAGTTLTATATFEPGEYRYFACLQVDGHWFRTGDDQRFRIVNSGSPVAPGGASPSGQSMPVGNLPGWQQVFAEDFTNDVARGGFPGPYAAKWMSYNGFPDTHRNGDYNQGIISAGGGLLDLYLHSEGGRPQVAAPIPLVGGKWGGQTYGRFSVRFTSDAIAGYKTAWLLWPDSNDWNQGEVDFPEGSLNGTIWGYHHCVGQPQNNCHWLNTGKTFTGWHTATIEWTPGKLVFLLDDKIVGTTTNNIPTAPMHWVLQTETTGVADRSSSGHLRIDWATIYRYAP